MLTTCIAPLKHRSKALCRKQSFQIFEKNKIEKKFEIRRKRVPKKWTKKIVSSFSVGIKGRDESE